MDVSALLSADGASQLHRAQPGADGGASGAHPYPTRHNAGAAYQNLDGTPSGLYSPEKQYQPTMAGGSRTQGLAYGSPASQSKRIRFELILQALTSPQRRNAARLPMRVSIWPHDTTESIISTVKNFFGLYEGQGVSFEDRDGNTLIARHENFDNDMVVYVRTTPGDYDSDEGASHNGLSPKRPRLGPPIEMGPPGYPNGNGGPPAGPRAAGQRSESPSGSGRRGTSVGSASKSRSRPSIKGRTGSAHGSLPDANAELMHDDSDTASVSSSRRGKSEVLVSAEISVENIVEGGRRKRAKFDSSELPLFVPTQVPMTASVSSVSPQRRVGSGSAASPFQYNNSHTFAYQQPLPSPQSYNASDVSYMGGVAGAMPHPPPNSYSNLYQRGAPARPSMAAPHILPTPDPTIGGSVISDEDVAIQLMRLGEASNFSTHGRTSTSTINEDAMSGKAEVASSAGDSDMGSDDGLPRYAGDGYSSGEDYDDHRDSSFKGESDEVQPGVHMAKMNGVKYHQHHQQSTAMGAPPPRVHGGKTQHQKHKSKSKAAPGVRMPASPSASSLNSQSRKASSSSLNFQHQFGPDEEDLSSKPRCQRCRKSKKGCDRQRPCGRCKDAGIGIDGCVSEDEGNGRKGRYGRHMGVPVKKDGTEGLPDGLAMQGLPQAPPLLATAYSPAAQDAGKKRKR